MLYDSYRRVAILTGDSGLCVWCQNVSRIVSAIFHYLFLDKLQSLLSLSTFLANDHIVILVVKDLRSKSSLTTDKHDAKITFRALNHPWYAVDCFIIVLSFLWKTLSSITMTHCVLWEAAELLMSCCRHAGQLSSIIVMSFDTFWLRKDKCEWMAFTHPCSLSCCMVVHLFSH